MLGNLLIVLAILGFVFLYVDSERHRMLASKTEAFENMTVAMENVATNYLVGEQRVCDSWANYINANALTAEEAIAFVHDSVTDPNIMAHILFTEDGALKGLSTEASVNGSREVSYGSIDIFGGSVDTQLQESEKVNVTRAYTNPTNGIQSIAFCRAITLRDAQNEQHAAVLLRIVPVSSFEQKWAFPTEDYKSAEIALIDAAGDYIIKGRSFKNSNFYEFFRSYNAFSPAVMEELKANVGGQPGAMEIDNARHQRCMVAHTRVNSTDDWIIVTMIPMEELDQAVTNWTLVGIVTAGLLLLLAFNITNMLRLNRELKDAATAAERANQAKTDFLSTMSHDIRTPMNAIIGLTAIASKNAEDTAAVRDSLRKINLAGSHLLTLINDILDISKV